MGLADFCAEFTHHCCCYSLGLREIVYIILAVLGLVNLWWYVSNQGNQAGTLNGLTFQGIPDFVSTLIQYQTTNGCSTAVWLSLLLGISIWTTIICRCTPGRICKRLLWQYYGSIIAVGHGFPLQLACGPMPETPGNDSLISWVNVVIIYGGGALVTFIWKRGMVQLYYIFVLWVTGLVLYDHVVPHTPKVLMNHKNLGFVSAILGIISWSWAAMQGDGVPWENWWITFFFFDYIIFTLTAMFWAWEHTGKCMILLVTLFLPAAGMCFTLHEIDTREREKDVEPEPSIRLT